MNEMMNSEKYLPPNQQMKPNRKPMKFKLPKLKKGSWKTITIILIIIITSINISLGIGTVRVGVSALMDSYNTAYASEKDAAYQTQYQKYYKLAEGEYHVGNRVSITIGDLKETAMLEVLKVSDVEYIIEESAESSNNITSWLEVPGQGTYVVNLQSAEFIVDDERAYLLVRVPYPQLTNISIDYANVKKLFFKNDILNDSYKVGEELAHKQLATADLLIKKEYATNQYFYLNAQKAAIRTIQCLAGQLNPNVPDLTVEVEFY